jgi:hypothetical protein
MTKQDKETSLRLINKYVKEEFEVINEITFFDYKPVSGEDFEMEFYVKTDNMLFFSQRYKITTRIKEVFNLFDYNVNCNVMFNAKIKTIFSNFE